MIPKKPFKLSKTKSLNSSCGLPFHRWQEDNHLQGADCRVLGPPLRGLGKAAKIP
jgi:hypothetical protein